jgi:formate dehydrogenase maturation protein FdhE
MEEIYNLLEDLLTSTKGLNDVFSIKVEEQEDGSVVFSITPRKQDEEIKKIIAEMEEIDDDIFTEAVERLSKSDVENYNIMANIEHAQDLEKLQAAYKIFKTVVIEVVEDKLKELSKEVNRLYNKYLNK